MDDLRLMFSDVLFRPADDGPRLAFADAVEADDPPWAEFIRLQVEVSRARRAHADYDPGLSTRAETLRHQHGQRWVGRIDQFVSGWAFDRGFVGHVWVDAEWFLESSDDFYGMAPIMHLDFSDAQLVIDELVSSPALDRIRSISLRENDIGDDEVALLAASTHLGALEWLDLGDNHISEAGLDVLAASPNLPRLGYVRLEGNPLRDPIPRFNDEYASGTPEGDALQAKYGRRHWLTPEPSVAWPPGREAAR